MNLAAIDKGVSSIFRAYAKEIKPDANQKLRDRFFKVIEGARQDAGEELVAAFELVRNYWHEASRRPADEYAATVRSILVKELPQSAAQVFLVCLDSLTRLDSAAVANVLPNSVCADSWLKASKADKKAVLKTITSDTESYYGSAWGDWFVKKAPVKAALPMVRIALEGRSRAAYLPTAGDVLRTFLKRDKKGAVAETLALDALLSSEMTQALVRASVGCGAFAEPYARAMGTMLAKQGDAESASTVAGALDGLLQERDIDLTVGVSHFAAHVLTTWRMVATDKAIAVAEERLLSFAAGILLGAQARERSDLWFACTSGAITERVLSERGKVSPQGALQVALALRSAETDARPADALWSAAFNLGIRDLEQAGGTCLFDPKLHEDSKGGLLRGDSARVAKCGWQFGEQILVRALVEPA